MNLKVRKCPNCGSNSIVEKDGTYACMNCRTFFDDVNSFKITQTVITRDETKIEKYRTENKDKKMSFIMASICFGFAFAMIILVAIIIKK